MIMERSLRKIYAFIILLMGIIILFSIKYDKESRAIISISSNYFNSCYVTNEGDLYLNGLNLDKTFSDREIMDSPVMINTDSDVIKAVVSLNSVLYYDKNGDAYMIGMVGMEDNIPIYSSEPVKLIELKDIIDIAAGEMHYMALDINGDVWVWGKNNSKQVSGNLSESYINKPIKREGMYNVKGIACGYYTSCAYTDDRVILWGEDSFSITGEYVFVEPYHIEMRNINKVSIGRNHMLIGVAGEIYGFGSNCFGQMGDGSKGILYGEPLNFDINDDINFSCGYTSSVFCINGDVYYLGDINPFSQNCIPQVTELTKLDIDCGTVIAVDISAFHLVYTTSDDIYYIGNNDYGQCGKKNNDEDIVLQEKNSENIVAILDTGFDTNNTILSSALCSKKNLGDRTTYDNCSMFNLMEGKENVYASVLSDGHGTAIMGSVIGIKQDDSGNLLFNNNIKVLSLKVMNENGGRFIDFITGLRISEFRQARVANCSLSIEGKEYKTILQFFADNSKMMIVFAINNNEENDSVLVNSEKVVYVMNKKKEYKINVSNVILIDSEEITVVLPENRLATMSGNSIAASIATNKIMENIPVLNDITFSTILEADLFGN